MVKIGNAPKGSSVIDVIQDGWQKKEIEQSASVH